MIARIRRYYLNLGPFGATWNLLVLAYLTWLAVRSTASAAALVIIPCALAGLFLPRLFLTSLIPHASRVLQTTRFAVFAIIVTVALLHFGVVARSVVIYLALTFLAYTIVGVTFWLISDERIMTDRGSTLALKRQLGIED
ncbi:MAG: hypothetical protein CMJ31_13200 [Phycisphaerae bacterium]|nr:hypothetical protein [Phycisphaerae bacterium]